MKVRKNWAQQMRQHKHNAHKGSIKLAIANVRNISTSPSVTDACRISAIAALTHLNNVNLQLVDRINEDGTISHLKWNDPPSLTED